MMGMLNSVCRFFIPALSPAMFNIATIACAFAVVPLMPRFGLPPILGIAIGTLVGGVGQALLQWPALGRKGSATVRSSTSAIPRCARSSG